MALDFRNPRGHTAPIRLSVIVPVFDAKNTIACALDSVLAQDFSGAEIIVVDDGSTDKTPQILEAYASSIHFIRQQNRGAAAARNIGVSAANGEYLAFLDADDVWTPDKLTKTCRVLDENPEAVLAFSAFHRMAPDGSQSEPKFFGAAPSMADMLARRSEIFPSTVVMRRNVFERCGGFCERFFPNCFEDLYMWILAREHGRFIYIPECLASYRMRDWKIPRNYLRNGDTFLGLVSQRYGRDADGLVKDTRDHLARVALRGALDEMDHGNILGVLSWVQEILHLRPAIFLEPTLISRMAKTHNLRRLFKSLLSSVGHQLRLKPTS
jgi:glycosyltransferase involved in cell wall biosynthesis